jgi:hypothetical protein
VVLQHAGRIVGHPAGRGGHRVHAQRTAAPGSSFRAPAPAGWRCRGRRAP